MEGKALLKTINKKQEAQPKPTVAATLEASRCNEVTMDESDLIVENENQDENVSISSLSSISMDDTDEAAVLENEPPPTDAGPPADSSSMNITSD